MVFYPGENNPTKPGSSNPSLPTFDLQTEKRLAEEITSETKRELLEKWKKRYSKAQIFPSKLSSANTELIEFLLSFKNTLFYNDLAKKFSFSPEQRDLLPQLIWKICLAKNWYGLENLLQSEMKVNPSVAGQATILINQNILFKAKELGEKVSTPRRFAEEKIESGIENIPIQSALKRYPELGEQLITAERITLTSFPGPVRPSIKNWLADYSFVMGYEKERSAIDRTAYLFHNPNTKKLSVAEREKLSYILKSLDENSPITVNKNTKQVMFPQIAPKPAKKISHSDAGRPAPQPVPQPASQTAPRPVYQATSRPPVQSAPTLRPSTPAKPIPKPSSPEPARPSFQAQPASAPTFCPVNQPTMPQRPAPVPAKSFFQAPPTSKPTSPAPQQKPAMPKSSPAPKQDDMNLRFTSPHTLPFEKGTKAPLQPHRITPFSTDIEEDAQEKKVKATKNVINLKE